MVLLRQEREENEQIRFGIDALQEESSSSVFVSHPFSKRTYPILRQRVSDRMVKLVAISIKEIGSGTNVMSVISPSTANQLYTGDVLPYMSNLVESN